MKKIIFSFFISLFLCGTALADSANFNGRVTCNFSTPPLCVPGVVAWYDASDTSTLTQNASGYVSAWSDKSGNGYTLNQTTETKKPKSVSSALNNRNALLFWQSSATHMTTSVSSFSTNNNDMFMVVYFLQDVNNQDLIGGTTTSAFTPGSVLLMRFQNVILTGRAHFWNSAAAATTLDGLTKTFSSVPYIFNQETDDTNIYFWLNGQLSSWSAITGSKPTISSLMKICIGARWANVATTPSAYIAEVLIFNRSLGTNERAQINGYLAHKWGVY